MKTKTMMIAALGAGIATAWFAGQWINGDVQIQANAQWREVMKSPDGLISGADLIVLAEMREAVPKTVTYGEADETIPYTQNFMAVSSVIKGEFEGDTLLVEQTGGILTEGVRFDINDGGPYEEGKLYLLFLRDQGNGSYYVINHQARYELDQEKDVLIGVDPSDPVVAAFHGEGIDKALYRIEERAASLEK